MVRLPPRANATFSPHSVPGEARTISLRDDATDPRSNGSPWAHLLMLFVGSRGLIIGVAWLGLLGFSKAPGFTSPGSPADWFVRWDAGWYLDVAKNGYWIHPDGTNVVFLPLYPLCIHLASFGGIMRPVYAAYGVSALGLWSACVLLARIVEREWHDRALAVGAVEFLLFGPVSFFFSAPFSESLFLPLALGSVYAARQRRWWLAGVCGALAALTRFVGVVLVLPLLWEAVDKARSDGRLKIEKRSVLPVLLPLVASAVYGGLMWAQFGDPLAYFHGQARWGRHLTLFWEAFAKHSFWHLSPFYRVWFAATAAGSLVLLAVGAVLGMPTSFSLMGIAFTVVYLSASGVEALPRYFSVVFPLYIAVALCVRRWPAVRAPLFAASVALQTISVILFVNGYWFT